MDIGYVLTVLGVILVSMTLHEAMHGFVANWLGDDTAKMLGRLTLNPFKHIDPFLTILLPMTIAITNMLTGIHAPVFGGAKPVPINPSRIRYGEWGTALVALSGPMTNFFIAFVAFAVLTVTDIGASRTLVQLFIEGEPSILTRVLVECILVNLGFFTFNILPIPPLDGSRVLFAVAPDFVRRGMEAVEQYGIMFIFAIVLLANSVIGAVMGAMIVGIIQFFGAVFGVA